MHWTMLAAGYALFLVLFTVVWQRFWRHVRAREQARAARLVPLPADEEQCLASTSLPPLPTEA